MKLMFVSDIHGSLSAIERALELYASSGSRWLVILGDVLNHGPRNPLPVGYNPVEVANCLNKYADRIIAVRGNCDSEVDQMLLEFPIMAPWQHILLEERRLFLTHGHLYHPAELPPLTEGDVLVYGHTHLPAAERQGRIVCFNPGSVSLPKGGREPSYGMMDSGVLQVRSLHGTQILAEIALDA